MTTQSRLVLPLDLRGRLRRIDALPDAGAVGINEGRIARSGQDGVLEVRVLEDEVVDLVRTDLPRVAEQERVVVVRQRSQRARQNDRAGAVDVGVALVAVA